MNFNKHVYILMQTKPSVFMLILMCGLGLISAVMVTVLIVVNISAFGRTIPSSHIKKYDDNAGRGFVGLYRSSDSLGATSFTFVPGPKFEKLLLARTDSGDISAIPTWGIIRELFVSKSYTMFESGEEIAGVRAYEYGFPFRTIGNEQCLGAMGTLIKRGVINIANQEWPIRPLPFGVVMNTVVYGLIYVVLLWMWRFWRWGRRITTMMCPRCTYPFAERHVCSECGLHLSDSVRHSGDG